MPLSFGIPLGMIVVVVGVILFFATNYKKMAKIILGMGTAITLLTFIVIWLVANSPS